MSLFEDGVLRDLEKRLTNPSTGSRIIGGVRLDAHDRAAVLRAISALDEAVSALSRIRDLASGDDRRVLDQIRRIAGTSLEGRPKPEVSADPLPRREDLWDRVYPDEGAPMNFDN